MATYQRRSDHDKTQRTGEYILEKTQAWAHDGDMAATHTGATIRISDLVPVGGELSDTTFIECAIHGPAILFSEGTDGITWRGTNNFNARTSAAILWPIDDDRESVTGLLHLTRCVFQDCTFQNVGLAARNLQEAGDAVRKAGPAGWNGHH